MQVNEGFMKLMQHTSFTSVCESIFDVWLRVAGSDTSSCLHPLHSQVADFSHSSGELMSNPRPEVSDLDTPLDLAAHIQREQSDGTPLSYKKFALEIH